MAACIQLAVPGVKLGLQPPDLALQTQSQCNNATGGTRVTREVVSVLCAAACPLGHCNCKSILKGRLV